MVRRGGGRSGVLSALILTWVGVIATEGVAQGNDPFYIRSETFALQRNSDGTTTGEVIAFLPRRYLIFLEDRHRTRKISKNGYLAGRTQDGVEVYVLESNVSSNTFRRSSGEREIIFNTESSLCKKAGCSMQNDDTVWRVNAGDSFDLVSESDIVELKGDENISAFVTAERLETLMDEGVVTRADQTHPRYTVQKTKVAVLSTECGETVLQNSTKEVEAADLPVVKEMLKGFSVGQISGSPPELKFTLAKGFGGEGKIFQTWRYAVHENGEQAGADFSVVARYTFKCNKQDGFDETDHIEKAEFWNSNTDSHFSILSDEEKIGEFHTPDLHEHIKGPYLVSINNYDQYYGALKILSKRFADRSLAGYFISEINRSCRSEDRAKGDCQNYTYPWVRVPRARPENLPAGVSPEPGSS